MKIKNRLNRLKKSKGGFERSIIILMKYFHWSLEDVTKLSVPSFFLILKEVKAIEDEKSKRIKGKNGR